MLQRAGRPTPTVFAALLSALLSAGAAAQDLPDWQDTLDHVAAGVVSIRVDHTRAFDENWNQSTQATGFVVDRRRGIILTNRHVVGPGPATAQAIFLNQEEVDLVPLYRDPVHDFGFFRFDPDALRFMEPSELKLAPDAARIGTEIRVVGNDAGEQLSILDGTIARLDRGAPDYGNGKYNDFNTYYYQAASGSSGGSSGSPVVDRRGRVVALNAGSRSTAATSYFLPLYQVVRALGLLQRQQPIPRGSLHTTYAATPYADLLKLGLSAELESRFRSTFPGNANMLVVERILPGSSPLLRVGDILVSLNGRPIGGFKSLAEALDGHVDASVEICVQRAGTDLCGNSAVYNLADVTPTNYLEFDGAVLHDLSYQRARHFNRPARGVFLADPGFSFAQAGLPKDSLITEIAGQPVTHLDDLQAVLETTSPGQQVNVRYITLAANQAVKFASLRLDHTWFPARRCSPGRSEGVWQCRSLPPAKPPRPAKLQPAPAAAGAEGNDIAAALVHVSFNMPFPISGSPAGHRSGTGIVVDRDKGRVLVSRTVVTAALGNVFLTFGGALEVPGRVLALHPTHNLALVAYDPALLESLPVSTARLAPGQVAVGASYTVIGLDNEHTVRRQQAALVEIEPVQFPLSSPPRFQNANSELLQFVNGPTDYTGVVINGAQEVVALWQKFVHRSNNRTRTWHRGVDVGLAVDFLQRGEQQLPWYDLGAGWFPTSLAEVRKLGLPEAQLKTLQQRNGRRLFELQRLTHGTAAAAALRTGDILLQLDGQLPHALRDIDAGTQQPRVDLQILRDGRVRDVRVDTSALSTEGLQHVIFWAGALIQPPPAVLARERQLPLQGVYVSFYKFGSPASRAGLVANLRIIEIDEQPVTDMAAFAEAVAGRKHRQTVRLRVLNLNNQDQVLTLKLDNAYWPGYELRKQDGRWLRSDIKSG